MFTNFHNGYGIADDLQRVVSRERKLTKSLNVYANNASPAILLKSFFYKDQPSWKTS